MFRAFVRFVAIRLCGIDPCRAVAVTAWRNKDDTGYVIRIEFEMFWWTSQEELADERAYTLEWVCAELDTDFDTTYFDQGS